MAGIKTVYLTDSQEKRFNRDNEVYNEYTEMLEKRDGRVSKWKFCQMIAPKYNVVPMSVWRIIERVEKYLAAKQTGRGK